MNIVSMQDIERRFDAIRDHKPKAAKKLSELAEILTLAYRLDPVVASDMWGYIVELNIADNVGNAKFYVAQVFNKITQTASSREAAGLIAMDYNRVKLLALNGYDGLRFWTCLEGLLCGLIECDMADEASAAIKVHLDKYGGVRFDDVGAYRIIRIAAQACGSFLKIDSHSETAIAILESMRSFCDDDATLIVETCVQEGMSVDGVDPEARLFVLRKCKEPKEFFGLLWEIREELDSEELCAQWVAYVDDCDDDDILPHGYFYDGEFRPSTYGESKRYFYINLIKDNHCLLNRYFDESSLHDLEFGIIEDWIFEGYWDNFIHYVAEFLNNSDEISIDVRLMQVMQQFMDACFYGPGRDEKSFGRSMRDAMRYSKELFADALACIVAATVGCSCYDDLKLTVKQFLQRLDGNLHRFQSVGIYEKAECRSAEQRLEDYAIAFLKSGKDVHPLRSKKFSLILDSFQSEGIWPESMTMDSGTVDVIYRIACNEPIVKLLFEYHPSKSSFRANMILACIRKNDINRAIELVDMMPKHGKTSGAKNVYTDDWGYQSMCTMKELIARSYDCAEGITAEMRLTVNALVDRVVPLTPERSQRLIAGCLARIKPEDEKSSDNYIAELLGDLETYTTFPYTRDAMRKVNELSHSLAVGFDELVLMGRLDVVSYIMDRLGQVRGQLVGVQYSTWESLMVESLRNADPTALVTSHPNLMKSVIKKQSEYELMEMARKIKLGGNTEAFSVFRKMVVSQRGDVEGFV